MQSMKLWTAGHLLRWAAILIAVCFLFKVTLTHAGPYSATQCAASRFGSNLNCTANDVSINTITVASGSPTFCVGGQTIPLNLNVTVNFGSATRYDIGVFVSNDGKTPQTLPANGGASTCSVAVLPTTSPFYGSAASGGDGDSCGDGSSSINGGTGQGTFTMNGVAVPCTTDGSGNTTLSIPYVVTWDQNSGNFCGDNTYPVPGTTSKCNSGTVTFPAGTTITVLPAISITDGVTTVRSGGTVTYTVVISNTTGSVVSGAVFTDPAVANLTVGSVSCTAGGGASCPASSTVPAMQGSGIALPDMPINSTLTFTITGTVATVTSPTTLTNTAIVSIGSASNPASDTDTILAPPTVTKVFSPSNIGVNGTSTLTITLINPDAVAITGAAFLDTYPANMLNTGTPGAATTCTGGTVTAAANGSALSLSGATIPASGSCTVTVNVTGTAVGSYANSTGTITTTNAGTGSAASGTLNVLAAPTVQKNFGAANIAINGTTTLTIVLSNPNATAITGVGFVDSYPSANLKNAAVSNLSNGCGGTATAAAGASTLSLSGGTIPANSSCMVSVTVTASAAGTYTNNSGAITTTNAGSNSSGASASLLVLDVPTVIKSFSPSTIGVGGTSALAITITNPNSSTAISGLAFTDTYPSTNLKNAASPNLTNTCGGTAAGAAGGSTLSLSGGTLAAGARCTVSVSVTSSVAATYLNSTGAVSTANAGNGAAASATLTVVIMPTAAMSFNPNPIGVNGTSVLTVTLTNPTNTAVSAAFTSNTYPSNMKNTGTPGAATTCTGGTATAAVGGTTFSLSGGTIPANGSCTVTVNVTASVAGSYLASTGTITSNAATGNIAAASATLTVLSPLTVSIGFAPASILVGGTSVLTITLTNSNATAITGVGFTDNYPANMKNTGTPSLSNSCGGTATAAAGGTSLVLSGGTVAANGSCVISVNVTATAAGTYSDSTGTVSTSNAGNVSGPSATLTVSAVSNFNAFETSVTPNPGAISGNIYTKLAGTPFSLDVVAIGNGTQATSFNGNVQVELVANTGTVGTGYGSDNCPNPSSSTVIQTIASAAISSGRSTVGPFSVANVYRDVRVRITYAGASPTVIGCSADSFSIRPSAVTLVTNAGLAGPSATATPAVVAGTSYTLYATTTGNYGGMLMQDASKLTAQTTTQGTTVAAGGAVGTLTPTSLTANPSPPPSSNASYTEVGYLYLSPGAYRDDAFTSVDQPGDCIADTTADANLSDVAIGGKYGCSIGNKVTVSLGRFIPDHFGVAGTVQTRSDLLPATGSTFTYMDEPMKMTLTVTAFNAADAVTQNYAGIFAKLDAATLGTGSNWFNTGCAAGAQCMGLGAKDTATGLSGRLGVVGAGTYTAVGNPTSAWSAGVGTFTVNVRLARSTAPDGPYETLAVGAMPHDSEGVTLPGTASTDTHRVDMDATTGNTLASNPDGINERRLLFTTKARFGRLRMISGQGSELNSYKMLAEAQFWNGSFWVTNALDSLTPLAAGNVGIAWSGSSSAPSLSGVSSLTGGFGSISLGRPGGIGTATLCLDLLSTANGCTGATAPAQLDYLFGNWLAPGTNYNRDPEGRVQFGRANPGTRANSGFIYRRENF